jgi:hypothetical protein
MVPSLCFSNANLGRYIAGEEAGAREEVVARIVQMFARIHPDVQSALLNAGAVRAITSRWGLYTLNAVVDP